MKTKYLIIPVLLLFLFAMNSYAQGKKDKTGGAYLTKAEVMPEPVGGIAAIMNKIHYPEIAKRAGIQGKVYITAKINEDGIVKEAIITKGLGGGCDSAAVTAVKQTQFTPGKNNGKPVKVMVTIPVLFKLKKSK